MCGLTGFIDAGGHLRSEELEPIAARMAGAVTHRGPDDAGTWMDERCRVAFGHRRLAILDLSSEGHQPMYSSCERYVLSFNGEIYNFRDLRSALEGEGRRFRGHSDTEVMVEAFSAWGFDRALVSFNGMFAFSLFDRSDQRLYLARDRMGEKPMYYGWMGATFLFGSELKALRAHPHFSGSIDKGALTLFLRHSYIPAPLSIYEGIRKLPPATYVEIDPRAAGLLPEPVVYWSLRDAAEQGSRQGSSLTEDDAVTALDQLLGDAVRLRMEADVPLGAFLSGGVDSSTIVALMQAHSTRPARTFTIGFHELEYNEAEHAKAVAHHLGTDHTELYVTPNDALDVIPKLPSMYDEPFSDSSQIPTFLVSDLTRRHVTVSLSGDGGDELFGSYPRYAQANQAWRAVTRLPAPLRRPAARALRSLATDRWARRYQMSPVLPRLLRRNPAGRLKMLAEFLAADDPEAIHLGFVSNWQDPASVVTGASEPTTALTDRSRWAALPDLTHRLMYLDALTYLPDDILVKVDRASMAVSLEARVPLLDHRVVEFLWHLPLDLKVRGDETKWLLRRVLHRYVPEDLIDRTKRGFTIPMDAWLRGPLRDWAESLLDARRIRDEGFFEHGPISRKWSQHLAGTHEWGYLLWDVLMFQAWLEATTTEVAA